MIIHNPVITGSLQVNGTSVSSIDQVDNISGSVVTLTDASGSFSSRVSGVESSVNSLNTATSSYALQSLISGAFDSVSASLASNVETRLLNTTDTLDGDLTVTGKITAQEFHTEFVSASIIYQSGSTQFGDSADDVHSFTGNVGIGTNSPATKLNIRTDASDDGILLEKTDGTDIARLFYDGSSTNGRLDMFSGGVAKVQIHTNGTSHFSGGNVGIGTNNPSADLQVGSNGYFKVDGTNSATPATINMGYDNDFSQIYTSNFGGNLVIMADASNTKGTSFLLLGVDNDEKMRITSEGRIGIGISSPSVAGTGYQGIHINNPDSTKGSSIILSSGNTNFNFIYTAGTNGRDFQIENPGDQAFRPGNSEKMRITSAGNVGIGTTNPTSKLHVNGDISNGNGKMISYYLVRSYTDVTASSISLDDLRFTKALIYVVNENSGNRSIVDLSYRGGAGVAYLFHMLDPDGNFSATNSVSWSEPSASAGTNAYSLGVNSGSGVGSISRTSGSSTYSILIYRLAI